MKRVALSDIICKINNYNEERTIIRDALTGKDYDYKHFAKIVNQLARTLKMRDVKKIVAQIDNSMELLVFYFAAMFSGTTIIPVDPEKDKKEIQRIKQNHPDAVLVTKDRVKAWVCNPEMDYQSDEYLDFNLVDFGKNFLITYTSGSTGVPKGVIHSAQSLFIAAYSFGSMMGYDAATVMGHCMPMTYMAGILNTIVIPFVFGGIIVIMPRFSVKTLFNSLSVIKSHDINAIWLSPTMLRMINLIDKKAEMKEYFRKAGMKISVGTAPLDVVLRETFENKYDVSLYQSYGLSETLIISTEIPECNGVYHTVGKLLPEIELRFMEDGEIAIGAPWMFKGYVGVEPDGYFEDGYYLTGDLGVTRGNNNLLITGRKKDLIIRGGYNINPHDIENIIIENGLAEECAVVAINLKGEESIAACCVSEKLIKLNEMNDIICQELGAHFRVDVLECVKTLPKSLNGKIDRNKIQKEIGGKWL